MGFQISGGSPQEGLISFTGDVAKAERAFDVRIMTFGDGSKFANTTEPEVPAAFASMIGEILGLHNMGRLAPDAGTRQTSATETRRTHTRYTHLGTGAESSSAVNVVSLGGIDVTFAPPDFYTFYDEAPLLGAKIDGAVANDCIGIFARSNVFPDILSYFTNPKAYGYDLGYELTPIGLTIDLVQDIDPGVDSDEDEAYLDIEWSHAVAPGAQTVLYLVDNVDVEKTLLFEKSFRVAMNAAVMQNKCGAISISMQTCGFPTAFYRGTLGPLFRQAAMQGQSVFISSGDRGADACNLGVRNVNELAASPNVVSVGGTQFDPTYDENGNDVGFVSESAWNDSLQSNAGSNATTGGGTSGVFIKPSWQRGPGVPNNNMRNIPDVAMIAGPPYVLVMLAENSTTNFSDSLSWKKAGGTSLGTPIWAGISRLIQQKTGTRLGNMNPTIYRLARAGLVASGFRDVTSGNNTYVNHYDQTVKGYTACPGYDRATGWGTVDINTFVNAYASIVSAAPTP